MTHSKVDLAIKGTIAALLIALGFVVVWSMQEHIVGVGDTAPNFTIATSAGDQVTPRNFGGKVLVLNFWASWCEPCVQEVPSLETLSTVLGPRGLVVLGVSQDKDPKAYQQFLDRFHVNFLTARDPGADIQTKYGTIQIPESYLIDTNGKVVEKIVSSTNWSSQQMIEHVQSLL